MLYTIPKKIYHNVGHVCHYDYIDNYKVPIYSNKTLPTFLKELKFLEDALGTLCRVIAENPGGYFQSAKCIRNPIFNGYSKRLELYRVTKQCSKVFARLCRVTLLRVRLVKIYRSWDRVPEVYKYHLWFRQVRLEEQFYTLTAQHAQMCREHFDSLDNIVELLRKNFQEETRFTTVISHWSIDHPAKKYGHKFFYHMLGWNPDWPIIPKDVAYNRELNTWVFEPKTVDK